MLDACKTIAEAMANVHSHPDPYSLMQPLATGNPALQKALQQGSGATPMFIQGELDPLLQLLLTYGDELLASIPRPSGTGQSYIINRRDEATEDLDASYILDTQDLDSLEATGEYDTVTLPYKIAAKRGLVSFPLIAKGKPVQEILQDEIDGRVLELKRDIVRAFLFGVVSTSKMDGLFSQNIAGQFYRDGTAEGGQPISLVGMDTTYDLIDIGTPKAWIMNKQTQRELSSLLQQQQQFLTFDKIEAGFRVMFYNGIPILTNSNVSIAQTFTGGTTTLQTGGSAASVYCVDWDNVFLKVLLPLMALPLGRLSVLYEKFDLMEMHVAAVRNPLSLSIYEGIFGSPLGS